MFDASKNDIDELRAEVQALKAMLKDKISHDRKLIDQTVATMPCQVINAFVETYKPWDSKRYKYYYSGLTAMQATLNWIRACVYEEYMKVAGESPTKDIVDEIMTQLGHIAYKRHYEAKQQANIRNGSGSWFDRMLYQPR